MPRGGKRAGAGRKKGSATRKTRAIADAAAKAGITPLEVMLAVMRGHYRAKKLDKAAAIARDAAPYIHPRLASVTSTVKGDLQIIQTVRGVDSEQALGTAASKP